MAIEMVLTRKSIRANKTYHRGLVSRVKIFKRARKRSNNDTFAYKKKTELKNKVNRLIEGARKTI